MSKPQALRPRQTSVEALNHDQTLRNQAFNAEGIRLALPQREVRYRGPDPST